MKTQKNGKTWKCTDCNVKLIINEPDWPTPNAQSNPAMQTRRAKAKQEAAVSTAMTVVMEGTSSETRNLHAWADKRHLFTKQRKRKEDNPLHPSIEAALNKLILDHPEVKESTWVEAVKIVN